MAYIPADSQLVMMKAPRRRRVIAEACAEAFPKIAPNTPRDVKANAYLYLFTNFPDLEAKAVAALRNIAAYRRMERQKRDLDKVLQRIERNLNRYYTKREAVAKKQKQVFEPCHAFIAELTKRVSAR